MKVITVRDSATEAWTRFSVSDEAWSSRKSREEATEQMYRALEEANDLKHRQELFREEQIRLRALEARKKAEEQETLNNIINP